MPAPFPIASLNGQLLRLDEVRISWNDRGFLYGDGLFETIRVHSGRPFLWEWHVTRLMDSAAALGTLFGVNPQHVTDIRIEPARRRQRR